MPPLRALLESPDLQLDGFIGPGHVATIVGARPFEFIPADYGKPIVISGFEPLDLLQSVQMIVRQLAEGRCEVENQYARVVPYEGNTAALRAMAAKSTCAVRSHSPGSVNGGTGVWARNACNVVKATLQGLGQLRSREEIQALRSTES